MRALFLLPLLLAGILSAAPAEKIYHWPGYPEPRHGLVVMKIDPKSGAVTGVTLSKSTGDRTLDVAAKNHFMKFRFKPGTPPWVRIHFAFTKKGIALIPLPSSR